MALLLPELPPNVDAAFKAFPISARTSLLAVRALIFEAAADADGVGPLTETLKWGEPAYLTAPRIGSTIRLGWKAKQPEQCAIYFNCNTTLLAGFRAMFADELTFAGARAITFNTQAPPPTVPLKMCLTMALRYHLSKKKAALA